MEWKAASGIMLTLLLIGTLTLTLNIQAAGSEPITINSVDPIINPKPGQYAHYIVDCYQENGTMLWSGWWNFSYIDYLAVDLINATHTIIAPGPNNGTFWLAINLTNRWIPYGNHWWVDSWYVPWIETNITVGSVIKMWKTNGTVIGTGISRIRLNGQETSIDCWKVQFSEPEISQTYTFLFDKQSGVGIQGTSSLEPHLKLTLVSTNIPIGTTLPLTINFNPCILNLRSKGRWITAYIELPESYDVSDINVSSIMLNDIPAQLRPIAIGDYDNDGVPDLMVKFSRSEVASYILGTIGFPESRFASVTLTITGKLEDGTYFQGSDTIEIIYTGPWRTFRLQRHPQHSKTFPM